MEPARFGSYEIISPRGTVGATQVFRARGPQGAVDLKKVLPAFADDPTFRESFLAEARRAKGLDGDHVVRVLDVGEVDGWPYAVTEAIEGVDLQTLLARIASGGEPLSTGEVAAIAIDAARALDSAHFRVDGGEQVLHRAVCPEHVRVQPDGTVKLLDFGIFKALSQEAVTRSGLLTAQFRYASPEYATRGTYTEQCDLYSLGVVLFESLAGRHPFEADNAIAMADKAERGDHPALSDWAPNAPAALISVIERLIEPDPSRRPRNAAELAGKLEAFAPTAADRQALGARVAAAAVPTAGSLAARVDAALAAEAMQGPPRVGGSALRGALDGPPPLDGPPRLDVPLSPPVIRSNEPEAATVPSRPTARLGDVPPLTGERTAPSALPGEPTVPSSLADQFADEPTALSGPPTMGHAGPPPAVIVDSRADGPPPVAPVAPASSDAIASPSPAPREAPQEGPLPWEPSTAVKREPIAPPDDANAAKPRKFKTMGMNIGALGGLPAAPPPPRAAPPDDPVAAVASPSPAVAVDPAPDPNAFGPVNSSGEEPTAVDGQLNEMMMQLRAGQDAPASAQPSPAAEAYPATSALPEDWVEQLRQADSAPPIQQRDLPSLPVTSSPAPIATPPPVVPAPEPARGMPRWAVVMLGFVAVVVVLGGCVALAVLAAAM